MDRYVFVHVAFCDCVRVICIVLFYVGDVLFVGGSSLAAALSNKFAEHFPTTKGGDDYLGYEIKVDHIAATVHFFKEDVRAEGRRQVQFHELRRDAHAAIERIDGRIGHATHGQHADQVHRLARRDAARPSMKFPDGKVPRRDPIDELPQRADIGAPRGTRARAALHQDER
jgi:hypothetical protein